MADSEIHKKKRRKNLTILALIFAWCLLIWLVTMIRIANADTLRGAFYSGRAAHLEKSEETPRQWSEDYEDRSEERLDNLLQNDEDRAARLQDTLETAESWDENYQEGSLERLEDQDEMNAARETHLEETSPAPQEWHDGWAERQEAKEAAWED